MASDRTISSTSCPDSSLFPLAPRSLLQFSLLGSISLTGTDKAPAFLSQTKRVALLAYLAAAQPYGSHTRDKVALHFFPTVTA